jgi:hypothetical protein
MSDASVSVWKTLGIWSKKVRGNPVAASDQRFILVTTANAPLGSALSKLRRDGTQRDVVGAIETLLAVASSSKNQSTATARQLFAALEPELLNLLIGNVWVFDNSPNIIDVRDELEQELAFAAPTDQINNYTDYLEGWWCSRIIECLAGLQDQSIQLYAIRNKIDELRDAFKFGNLPLDEDIEKMPAVDTLPNDNRMIIRQNPCHLNPQPCRDWRRVSLVQTQARQWTGLHIPCSMFRLCGSNLHQFLCLRSPRGSLAGCQRFSAC